MSHSLELSLGIYDPALRSVDGDYWAVRSQKLPRRLFEEAYALIVREADCEHPNALAMDDYWGGCLGLSSEWLAFYRFYNGGRDLVGRPDRGLLLVAVASRSAAQNYDCAAILDQPPFSEWALRQPLAGSPLHPGEGDPLTVSLPLASVTCLSVSQSQSDVASQEITSLSDLWAVANRLRETERFLIEFRRQNSQSHGRVILPPMHDPSPSSSLLKTPVNNSPNLPWETLPGAAPLKNPVRRKEVVPVRNIILMLCCLVFGVVIGWILRDSVASHRDSQQMPVFREPEAAPVDLHQKVNISPIRDLTAPDPVASPRQNIPSTPPRPAEHDIRSP